jgi:hypothetical protein
MLRDEPPALWHLALDIGLAGLALSVERVEREVEVMLGRLASVDGAASNGSVHGARSTPRLRHQALALGDLIAAPLVFGTDRLARFLDEAACAADCRPLC